MRHCRKDRMRSTNPGVWNGSMESTETVYKVIFWTSRIIIQNKLCLFTFVGHRKITTTMFENSLSNHTKPAKHW